MLLYVIICYAKYDTIISVCLFVSSVKCSLITVNLNKVMFRNPQKKCGMLDDGKTSNFEYNTVVTR